MNVNIYVLISNNATSEILMKYKQNVSARHKYNQTLTHPYIYRCKHRHSWNANTVDCEANEEMKNEQNATTWPKRSLKKSNKTLH